MNCAPASMAGSRLKGASGLVEVGWIKEGCGGLTGAEWIILSIRYPTDTPIPRREDRIITAIHHRIVIIGMILAHRLKAVNRYRGKASRRPPSTGRIDPVVLAERSEAKNKTASATSSGRILDLRRFR